MKDLKTLLFLNTQVKQEIMEMLTIIGLIRFWIRTPLSITLVHINYMITTVFFYTIQNISDEKYEQAYQYSTLGRSLNFGLKRIY